MRIPRIYQAIPLAEGEIISLDKQAAIHVARVLRLNNGDQIIVFNGEGGEYPGVIEAVDKRSVTVRLAGLEQPTTESPLQITLIQAVSRGERMDYTLQKSVELGVSEIHPVTTQHIAVHMDVERARKKQAHWQGIVNSACEQSGRIMVPTVHTVQSLEACVEQLTAQENTLFLILDHRGAKPLTDIHSAHIGRIVIVVGPEGGLSEEERQWLISIGFVAIAIGPRVLRTETAAIAAIAIMQAHWGDFK
ncbi:16S rRNA (uracil(1498)-N(3))-methyltransferase [Kaarinaea lacus]